MPILISIAQQSLTLINAQGRVQNCYPVSTAINGTGCQRNSYCTPTGRHIVRAKVGATAPSNAVFVARRWTGELCTPELMAAYPERDWILTRILWLSGTEIGRNRLGAVDTMQRYIYIHGTPDSVVLGVPGSRGCVRMRNSDVMQLFAAVAVGTEVDIQ